MQVVDVAAQSLRATATLVTWSLYKAVTDHILRTISESTFSAPTQVLG